MAQASYSVIDEHINFTISDTVKSPQDYGDNGFNFESFTTGINSEYSEIGVCFYRGKFITYSSRKIGALGKKDPRTNEPFTKLFCSDVTGDWNLDRPLLFSRILNKNESLGSLTFDKSGTTVFFTKGVEGNSGVMQLYRADMSPQKLGKWENITPLPFNSESYSVETPHLAPDGKTLYFSSNMPESKGGYDIYMVTLNEDGTYGPVQPVPGDINSEADEKFPHTSVDDKFMYFSSNGHGAIGGYDAYKSRRSPDGFKLVINLGNTINTKFDEIAFVPATKKDAYITSNREGALGGYDIYKITEFVKLNQVVAGKAMNFDTGEVLAGARIRLIDTEGYEVAETTSDANGAYTLPISSFEFYTVIAEIDGYQNGVTIFNSDNVTEKFQVDVSLKQD
ncbi:hypothetical protein BST85_10410 [Aureitalea marina]|uniref:Uncharacterized protein n=2 Tax=Aureitalea marina TaxID=930804 RepID=A0A2S7KRK8_9FLAO|nr:hypothetical protein BST85_10410 [Aureitalea marina]